MGGLAERFNPDKEALGIASGNSIYVWAYDRPQCVARRPRKVSSIEVHNESLLDAGNYNGVRDTLTGEIRYGPFQSWNNIRDHKDTLFGTVNTKNPQFYGVWDVKSMERVRKRNGRTILLGSGSSLMDSGEYITDEEFREHHWHGTPILKRDADIYDALQNVPLTSGSFVDRFSAVIPCEDGILTAASDEVDKRTRTGISLAKPFDSATVLYMLDSDIYQLWNQFSDLSSKYSYSHANRKDVWEQFREMFIKHKDSFPKGFSYIREEIDDGIYARPVKIEPLPFEEACRRYRFAFRGFREAPVNSRTREGFHLIPILRHASIFLLFHHYKKNRIQALADMNDAILVGGRSKRLEIADSKLQKEGQNILYEFSHPINSMVKIPIEVYNEGIRQKILKDMGRRAYFARNRVYVPLKIAVGY